MIEGEVTSWMNGDRRMEVGVVTDLTDGDSVKGDCTSGATHLSRKKSRSRRYESTIRTPRRYLSEAFSLERDFARERGVTRNTWRLFAPAAGLSTFLR